MMVDTMMKKNNEDLKHLSLVLYLKLKHMPKQVWELVIDTLLFYRGKFTLGQTGQ